MAEPSVNGCVEQEPEAGDKEVTHYSLTLAGTLDPAFGFLVSSIA